MVLLLLVAGVAGAAWWQWSRAPADDYDYAAAFESQTPGSTLPLLKIRDVVGKTADELTAVLGPSQNCSTTLYSSRCSYATGRTEVVFIDGKADWITVKDLRETTFAPAALHRIGLDESKTSDKTDSELIWTGLNGLKEVRIVGDGEHVEFIRVKAKS